MSDVNFLNNGKKEEEKDDKKGEEKGKKIDWSKVEKKEDKKEEKKGENKNNTANSDDINAWLESLKEDSNVEGKGAKELKTSKEALGEYQKVLRKSKKAAELKEGVKKVKGDGQVKEEKKSGIADIIKNKLSFGSKPKEEATIKTNLIKSEGVTYFDWKDKLKVLGINILLTLVILGTAYGYLEYRERGVTKKSTDILEDIENLKSKIEALEEEALVVDEFQAKLDLVNGLLEKHVYWTNFFEFLEANLLSDVYLDGSFSGDVNGDFRLLSFAPSFSDLTDQTRIIRNNEKINEVSIELGSLKTSGEGDVVEFILYFNISPEIFYK
jgi:hypothetical protein